MNTVHTLLDNVSLHCGVEESISRYLCSRGGQVERKTNSVGFYHQSVLEIDNSHTDLILVTAFCGCQPSQTPSLPFAFILLCFSLGTVLSPHLPLSSLLFQLQAYLEHVCFHAFSFHSQSLPPSHFLLLFPSSLTLTLVCVCVCVCSVHPSMDVRHV